MNSASLEELLRTVVVRSFTDELPSVNVAVDDGMLFGVCLT